MQAFLTLTALCAVATATAAQAASGASAAETLPPLGSVIYVLPAGPNGYLQALRHCDFVASFMPYDSGNEDFAFTLVAALDGAPLPAASIRSTNYPDHYLTLASRASGRAGIAAQPDASTASFDLVPSADGSNVTLKTRATAPGVKGTMLAIGTAASGPCNKGSRQPDAVFAAAGPHAFVLATKAPTPGPSPSPAPVPPPVPAAVAVDASAVDHTINEAVLVSFSAQPPRKDPSARARAPKLTSSTHTHTHPCASHKPAPQTGLPYGPRLW